MRVIPERRSTLRLERRAILGPWSEEFSTCGGIRVALTNASVPWPSANKPVAIPFRLSHGGVVDQLGWINGVSAGGNIDVGVYDESFARIIATGSQASIGNTLAQFVDVTDTALVPGKRYYLCGARDNAIANRQRGCAHGGAAVGLRIGGVMDSGTNAFPLPDPLTNMVTAATFTTVPMLLIAFRDPF